MTPRSTLARTSVLAASRLSRRLGLGAGSTVGGRVGLAIDPRLLARLARDRRIALVSGTNGKTTTTRLLAEALGGSRAVASSRAGANMPAGIVAALAAAPPGQPGVLEVDEGYLGDVARLVRPKVIVALNLSRDQLDRVGEVRMVAQRWRESFATLDATIVANCDDPLVVWSAGAARDVVWVGAGGLWRADAYNCPSCGSLIDFEPVSGSSRWSCRCGLRRPDPAAWLDASILTVGARSFPIALGLPGRFNLANATMAAVAATALGVETGAALASMAQVDEVEGRFATADLGGVSVRLMLAKNPAGWSELIELLAQGDRPAVIAINARDADGHDPSWLWDVPFERLARRRVVAAGERRLDLAVRLRHAGVEHLVADDQLTAVRVAAAPAIDYVGNYTAFQELRRMLRGGASAVPSGNEPAAGSEGPANWRFHPGGGAPSGAVPVEPGLADRADPHGPARGRVHPGGGAPSGAVGAAPADPSEAGPEAPLARVARRGAPRSMPLTVVVVHPDLLGTYGDAGNGAVLADRAAWRGIAVELVMATSDRPLPRSGDIYCLGGGEDGPQSHSAQRLADGSLAAAVASGAQVLAVCAGFQIIGGSFPGPGGIRTAGLGLIDVETVRGTGRRAVGEVLVEATGPVTGLDPGYLLSGFENHAGMTQLGPSIAALGRVLAGTGNGYARGGAFEGAVAGGIVGTYLHGPVLARNPLLADSILARATGTALAAIDDREEALLHEARLRAAPGRARRGVPAQGRMG